MPREGSEQNKSIEGNFLHPLSSCEQICEQIKFNEF